MAKANLQQQAASSFDTLFGARIGGERSVSGGFKMLAHARITVRPQVRRTFPPNEVDELRGSIHELRAQNGGIEGTGVLQALLVCPEGEGYRLIAGEKRFRATQAEGLPEVPCVVVPSPGEGMIRLLQLTENALRTPPPVREEARAIRETMDEQGLSQRDMARMLGKTLGYVSNRMAILKMGEDVQEMIDARGDTLKHAPLIEAIEDQSLRAELIRAVVEEEISVRELERRLAPREPENGAQVFSRENTSGDQNGTSSGGGESSEVFSRENTSGGDGAQNHDGQNGASSSGAPSLRGALRATGDAIERFRRAVLSDEERQKARDGRDALQTMIEELNEILG